MDGNTGTLPNTTTDDNNNNNNNNSSSSSTKKGVEGVQVTVVPAISMALKGVVNHIDFLFTITTPVKDVATIRAPCDISFVLDRSGSMSGKKLSNCKLAISQMVQCLMAQDRVHLVAYDDNAQIIFEQGNPVADKGELLAKIESISDGSCTNLHEGIDVGGVLLEKYKKDDRTSFRSMFVFSDGLANRGPSSKEEIFALVKKIHSQGASLSSYGIGADFDENMMKGIQEHGGGDYYFIENEGEISRLVNLGFKGLLNNIGSNAVLKIRGKNGGLLRKIYSHDDPIKGAVLGDLKSDNITQILARFEVTPGEDKTAAEVLTWELSYIPEDSQETTSLTGTFSINFTDDDKVFGKQVPNQQVKVLQVIQEVAETYNDVLKLIDQGNKSAAIALQETSIQKLKDVAPLDSSGIVEKMLISKAKGLNDLKTKDSAIARKKMHKERFEDARMDRHGYMEH